MSGRCTMADKCTVENCTGRLSRALLLNYRWKGGKEGSRNKRQNKIKSVIFLIQTMVMNSHLEFSAHLQSSIMKIKATRVEKGKWQVTPWDFCAMMDRNCLNFSIAKTWQWKTNELYLICYYLDNSLGKHRKYGGNLGAHKRFKAGPVIQLLLDFEPAEHSSAAPSGILIETILD